MRIPAAIYERLPQFWLLLGLLFMASGVFIGFGYWLSLVYLAVGAGCCAWSAWTLTTRLAHRRPRDEPPVNDTPLVDRPADERHERPVPNV